MESYSVRISSVVYAYAQIMVAFALLTHVVSLWRSLPDPLVKVENVRARDLTSNGQLRAHQSNLSFDIEYDLSREFDWGVKQLFVSLVCVYQTPQNKHNEVIVWDRIISKMSDAKLKMKNTANEYPLRDTGKHLKGVEVNTLLRVSVHPIIGYLYTKDIPTSSFTMPAEFFRDELSEQELADRDRIRREAEAMDGDSTDEYGWNDREL